MKSHLHRKSHQNSETFCLRPFTFSFIYFRYTPFTILYIIPLRISLSLFFFLFLFGPVFMIQVGSGSLWFYINPSNLVLDVPSLKFHTYTLMKLYLYSSIWNFLTKVLSKTSPFLLVYCFVVVVFRFPHWWSLTNHFSFLFLEYPVFS